MDMLPGSPLSTNKSSCGCYNQFEAQKKKKLGHWFQVDPMGVCPLSKRVDEQYLAERLEGAETWWESADLVPEVYTFKRFHLALNCKTNKSSPCSNWGAKWVRFAHKEREKGPPSRNPFPLRRMQVALCEFPPFLAQVRASWTSSCTRCVHYNTEWSLSNSEVLTQLGGFIRQIICWVGAEIYNTLLKNSSWICTLYVGKSQDHSMLCCDFLVSPGEDGP